MEKKQLTAKPSRCGYYNDCVPMVIIQAPDPNNIFEIAVDERKNIPIIIGGVKYIAGFRYWTRTSSVKICQDIKGADNNDYRLVDLLANQEIKPNQKITLSITENGVEIIKLQP